MKTLIATWYFPRKMQIDTMQNHGASAAGFGQGSG
jgi:hypothetical protein